MIITLARFISDTDALSDGDFKICLSDGDFKTCTTVPGRGPGPKHIGGLSEVKSPLSLAADS